MTSGTHQEVQLPSGLAAFRRLLHLVGQVEITVAVIALAAVVTLAAAQTALRYFFNSGLWWSQEVIQILVLYSYFMGVSYVFKTRQYILIEFLSQRLPTRLQLGCYLLAQVLTIAMATVIGYLFIQLFPTLMNMRTPLLGLPEWLFPLPLIAAMAMLVVTSLYYLAFGLWALGSGLRGTLDDIESHALVMQPLRDVELD